MKTNTSTLTNKFLFAPALVALLSLSACISPPKQAVSEVQSGNYSLDKSHASLVFSVQHMGLAWYTMRFEDFDASIDFKPDAPETSSVSAVINPLSISANHPEKGKEWDNELATDDRFLSANTYPDISFSSTNIAITGENTGVLTGDLNMLGTIKPIEMNVIFHGSNSVPWAPGKAIIGFSANGSFNRSEFGMTSLLPNTVSDEVRFQIEVEFSED